MKQDAARTNLYSVPTGAMSGGDFVEIDGERFAGTHLLIDLWDGKHLDDLDVVERALREAVHSAGATLLKIDLHHFTPFGGVSGVAILAESHMSIHTWPEEGYAALDIFVCGGCDAQRTVAVVCRHFETDNTRLTELRRGLAR